MNKFHLFCAAIGMAVGFSLAAPAAFAQTSPAGDMQAPKLQPQGSGETPLPAAIPGAGDQGLQTQQSVAKQQSGDPTTELFTAINAGDYSSAQDAISRGADLNAQNSLGETPIDLSVALNRNSITFMLLAARNDSGDDETDDSASAVPVAATPAPHYATPAKSSAAPVNLIENPNATPGNDPGTPNSSAGFLGFNH
jgi:ankyrin repeat protein